MPDDLQKLKFEISLRDASGEVRQFTTARSLNSFFQDEMAFWQDQAQQITNVSRLNKVHGCINAAASVVGQFVSNYLQWDENSRQQQLNNLQDSINNQLKQAAFSSTPFAEAFLEACRLGQHQAQVFWEFVINNLNGRIENIPVPVLEGAILGYEFLHQDDSVIYKRRDTERKSFSVLRKSLSEKTDELVGEVEQFKSNLAEWRNNMTAELVQQRDDDRSICEKFFGEAAAKRQELEKLYGEILRLKEPAKYWAERAGKYKKSGERWGIALVVVTVLSAAVFVWLLQQWLTTERILEKFTAHHWQSIVLLAAILSLAAFLIRVFSKLTFSAFHLQRDAEEREQLAYFYLALLNETEVSEQARSIVYQALFSRSETGLLSGEHGPTMPAADAFKQLRPGG